MEDEEEEERYYCVRSCVCLFVCAAPESDWPGQYVAPM